MTTKERMIEESKLLICEVVITIGSVQFPISIRTEISVDIQDRRRRFFSLIF